MSPCDGQWDGPAAESGQWGGACHINPQISYCANASIQGMIESGEYKAVYVGGMGWVRQETRGGTLWQGGVDGPMAAKREGLKYNFETGVWGNRLGEKYEGGERIE